MSMTRVITVLLFAALGCEDGDTAETLPASAEEAASPQIPGSRSVAVTIRDFAFEMPDTVAAGWVTLEADNAGQQEHFVYVYRLPEGKTFAQYQEEALVPFGRVFTEYATGELNRAEAERAFKEQMPGWFFTEVTPVGGVALLEPGEAARSTVRLEPGEYVAECYVKTPEGRWHTELGMMKPFTVVPGAADAPAPAADVRVRLTNYAIEVDGEFSAGTQVVSVEAVEDPDGFMKHDLNLFRLEDGQETAEIVEWMDWMEEGQFQAPGPGHSLGGMEHLKAGLTGYVHLDLPAGRYAWISEEYGDRGMVHEFTIEEPGR
jgi:hypothetical protein